MRALPMALLLAGCASSLPPDLPPELREPAAHIRPVMFGDAGKSAEVFVPDLLAAARLAPPEERCEILRHAARDGGGAQARRAFARCALGEGETERAWALLEDTNAPERLLAGLLSGRVAATEESLNAALEQHPHQGELWNLLGREYERQNRDAEAVEAFLRARQAGRVR